MRRLGRYPLAVMAWIAVYAGWSSVLGLVIAAVTGERLEDGDRIGPTVGLGVSTLFTVILPLVPTLVALWFNDWLRDGAPSKADRDRARRTSSAKDAARQADVVPAATPAASAPPPAAVPAPVPAVPRLPAPAGAPLVVAARPLGVPELVSAPTDGGGFPVARLLRDHDTAPASPLAAAQSLAVAAPEPEPSADVGTPVAPVASYADEPVIDPFDPLGLGDLGRHELRGR